MGNSTIDTSNPVPEFTRVSYLQPHWSRRKEILGEHPEVKALQRNEPASAIWIMAWVGIQLLAAHLVQTWNFSWAGVFIVAYTFGAFLDHGLWVMIHELTHDLVLGSPTANTFFLLFSNIPHIIPSAVSFRYYHRIHHSHLNETYGDPDVPLPIEDKIFGHSIIGKATWLSFFSIFQSVRAISTPAPIEPAVIFNWIFNGVAVYYILSYEGMKAFIYLLLSSLLSVGLFLHPLGARWIAEHWAIKPLQETYSYYGPINQVAFNIGYHNEHHDFPGIPWSKLPILKAIAPEFYEPLCKHTSYVTLLIEFILNPNFTLRSRVVRWPKGTNEDNQGLAGSGRDSTIDDAHMAECNRDSSIKQE